MAKKKGKTAAVTTYYDGGGGNKITVPEKEFINTRMVKDKDGSKHEEALVEVGGDSGGKNTEWVRVDD